MALAYHYETALAVNDSEGTDGGNTVGGAVVTAFSTSGDAAIMYDDDSGSNGSTAKQTKTSGTEVGTVEFWIEEGTYDIYMNGVYKRRVTIGSKGLTTEQLINSSSIYQAGDTVTTTGFTTSGDGGGAQWVASSTTGLTPSQTPADRADGELVDGAGRLWSIVGAGINPLQVGAIPESECHLELQAWLNIGVDSVINGVSSTFLVSEGIKINGGMIIEGSGMTIKADASKSLTETMISTYNSDAPTRTVSGLRIRNLTVDGASLTPQRWLQNPTTGATITDPEADYESGGIIAEGGDIFDVVAANRRNPNYTDTATMFILSCTEDTIIEDCTFSNHYGRAINEAGGKNVKIRNNNFINVGKNDGAYHAIWVQSFGNPASPTASFLDSENIEVSGNYAENLERGFISFNPTKGGKLVGNKVKGWGESCVFCNDYLNINGDDVVEMSGNKFYGGVITDITCQAFEVNGLEGIDIHDNYVEDVDGAVFGTSGCVNVNVKNNTTYNAYNGYTIPYGPFSERYSYAVGTTPIAGNIIAIEDGAVCNIGTFSGTGCKNLVFSGNAFVEDRGEYPSVFKQVKTGGDNLAESCFIFDNSVSIPDSMEFINTDTGNVWNTIMQLEIKNNKGHISNELVRHTKEWAASETGQYTVDVGFRPKSVQVMASTVTSSLCRQSVGHFGWTSDGVRNDSNVSMSVGSSQRSSVTTDDVITITDDSGNVTFRAEFVSWYETGFRINVTLATDPVAATFYCSA